MNENYGVLCKENADFYFSLYEIACIIYRYMDMDTVLCLVLITYTKLKIYSRTSLSRNTFL